MTEMTLHEAIVFVRDAKPGPGVGQQWDAVNFKFGVEPVPIDHAIASIMNAVASGDLIPRTDADLAVAQAYQRAHDAVTEADRACEGAHGSCERILALAPAEPLAEVERMRAERDNLSDKLELERALTDGAHRRAKAAETEVARLKEALRDIAGECGCSIARAALTTQKDATP